MKNNLEKYVILDVLTTGWKDSDEVLKLVIIDAEGRILFSECFNGDIEVSEEKLKEYGLKDFIDWDEEEICEIVKDKIILIPNQKEVEDILENMGWIHTEDSMLFVGKSDVDPYENIIQYLRIFNPKSTLSYLQRKSWIYFKTLCDYRKKQGDFEGMKLGEDFLMKHYGTRNFKDLTFEECEELIDLLHNLLKSLGILPKRI